MPSVRYCNQTAPFWDFVASLEDLNPRETRGSPENSQFPFGWAGPFGSMNGWNGAWDRLHRHHPHHPHHAGFPRAPQHQPQEEVTFTTNPDQTTNQVEQDTAQTAPPSDENTQTHQQQRPHCHRGCGGRRGGFGRRSRGGMPMGGPFGGLGALGEFFQSEFLGQEEDSNRDAKSQDYKPDVDIFDTESSFIVHVSLPGAKKEDVGVNWDAEKSELSIAGVTYRPGDEDFLKTLALDERKVGAFERKVRLGSRANPAQVEADGITAKLEDGVLRVEIPKQDKDYVEIRKVDIE